MKNPLLLLLPALLLSVGAAAQSSCPPEWNALRPYDLGDDGIKTLEPVAISSCEALAALDENARKKFWTIRKALIGVPQQEPGSRETVTVDKLPAILKTAVKEADAPQNFTAYEMYRIKKIIVGKSICGDMTGACKKA